MNWMSSRSPLRRPQASTSKRVIIGHRICLLRPEDSTAGIGANTCAIPTQALDFLVFECCPWRVPEADRQPVVGIHHADRDREIDQFLFLKDCARGLERFIRHAGL